MAIREAESRDGTVIVYRATGPAGARPLVLLHGWASNLQCWGAAADALAERFRVVAVDLRGHGYSGAPAAGYDDPANWAADVAAVLAAEGIAGNAVLLGWSYGGLVLTDYLAEHGTSAVAGVIYAGAITGIGRDIPGGRNGERMEAAIPGVFEESPGRAVRAFTLFGDANTGARRDAGVDAQRLFGASLATPPRVRKALFVRTRDNDATLRKIDVPALVLHGVDDPIVDIAAARYAAETIPGAATSFWPGAKHAPFIEDPARFVAEITDFVDAI
ncbi:MAG: alpha/beta hydrolase [Streptomycetaceae bacterium]|nr:alpha/beta hydrolase [Mycobacteriaceae bacterium]NUS58535.1 alpha/beta hydrolase [Streptomycetaceae bacterium]